MNNAFDYYDHLRKQQIHINKIVNPQVRVPTHEAYKPIKAQIQTDRLKQRLKKQASIQRENMHIMKKLCTINYRKPSMGLSHSTPSFSLPPIILQRKQFQIPEHQRQNSIIAQKLVNSKSSINVRNQLRDYHEKQKLKKNISKYHSVEGYNGSEVIDRKKYIAELMMLKKLKLAEQTQSRIKNYIMSSNPASSRVTRNNNSERDYYTNS